MKSRNDKKQHIGPCTHTSESTNEKVQTYFMCEITLYGRTSRLSSWKVMYR
jgi:hypothetical protein